MGDPRMMSSNMFDRAISHSQPDSGAPATPLPLNLIALIISYLDHPADLSRTCRACRVFHYIALPQLYSSVCLRSYDHIRYKDYDGRPEGCGMSSPFSMGLSGLVSRNVAGYVRRFEVCGEWAEHDLEEFAKVGRVPDGSMMLNTLVRVAIERIPELQKFSWHLNTKMLPTVWQAMAQKPSLTTLSIKFPSKRHPRPMALVPPIPNLQTLKITDIDPLCYADDISLLLLGSKKLQHLTLHWSPRMREAREPSTQPAAYFGRTQAAGYLMPLKSIAIQNLYTYEPSSGECINDFSVLEEVTSLSSTGGLGDDGSTAFLETGHKRAPQMPCLPCLKMIRIDKISRHQCDFLASTSGLERLYLVCPSSSSTNPSSTHGKDSGGGAVQTPPNSNTSSPHNNNDPSSSSSFSSSATTPSPRLPSPLQNLKTPYLDAIIAHHGSTLRHLLLPPHWCLTADDISRLIRQCPLLEQIAFRTGYENFKHLRLLLPFLSKLVVVRLLGDAWDGAGGEDGKAGGGGGDGERKGSEGSTSFVEMMKRLDDRGLHERKIGEETVNSQWSRVRYMELGHRDLIFEVGERYCVGFDGREVDARDTTTTQGNGQEERQELGVDGPGDGQGANDAKDGVKWRRRVYRRSLEDVEDIAIWRMAGTEL